MHTIRILSAVWMLFSAAASVSASEKVASRPSSVSLDWIAGHWCGQLGDAMVEEFWLPEVGGESLGMSRTVSDGRMVDFEFLRIVTIDGRPNYVAQPRGRAATAFVLDDSAARRAQFVNPTHDFPRRITYRRDGDALTATIAGPGKDGAEQSFDFEYRTCTVAAQGAGDPGAAAEGDGRPKP